MEVIRKAWKQVMGKGKNPLHVPPHDVPKGHLVVYVGYKDDDDKFYKRFVIKIGLLQDPIFRYLLDESRNEEAYDDFTAGDSKLCIHCDHTLFLHLLHSSST